MDSSLESQVELTEAKINVTKIESLCIFMNNNSSNFNPSFGQWNIPRKRKISETNDKSSDPEIQAENQSRNRMIAQPPLLDDHSNSNERQQDLTLFHGRLKNNNRSSGSR